MERQSASPLQVSLPVSAQAPMQTIRLSTGTDAIDLEIPVAIPAQQTPDFRVHYPLPQDWRSVSLKARPEILPMLEWEEPTVSASGPQDALRPEAHFTAPVGQLKDPNGLYYRDGIWNLFYQYNPFGILGGNTHWGHAISRDLIHWKHLTPVIYPDSLGSGFGTIWSGSAFIDHKNASGLGADSILLYYTKQYDTTPQDMRNAPSGWILENHEGTQNLAYSTDGGQSFHKYANNPLLPIFSSGQGCDRDPNVCYSPDDDCYYMALYFGDERTPKFALFKSQNLLDWTLSDNYRMNVGRECPGILHMQDEITRQWKWVFTEASGHYRIATIAGGKITFETEPRPFVCGNAYAGQFFHDAPDNRQIYLGWLRMQKPYSRIFNGSMTSPMSVILRDSRLIVRPYAICGKAQDFTCKERTVIALPEGDLTFDLLTHKVSFNNQTWDIPTHLTELHGILVCDKVSLEYFDDTGTFTFCLSCLTE